MYILKFDWCHIFLQCIPNHHLLSMWLKDKENSGVPALKNSQQLKNSSLKTVDMNEEIIAYMK